MQSKAFFADIRNFYLPQTTLEAVTTVLSECRGIDNLWVNGANWELQILFPLIEDLPLKRLHCSLHTLFVSQPRIDFNHRLFSQITHLEVFDYPSNCFDLALIPHLTHLSFNKRVSHVVWLTLLRTCPSLRVLIGLMRGLPTTLLGSPDEQDLARDPRFVTMYRPDALKNWAIGANTGIDYWSRAEEFIAKRRSGEVDALQYQIPGP
ncbi:hypothetical protein B0H13DRAFT_2262563 [Mycena leptocephala]|nr:hypothetical protein B0H13DRAFT_2262563 [Mycena leptocephala]